MSLLPVLLFAFVDGPTMQFTTAPRPIAGAIAHSDYPKAALHGDMQGRVEALLTINEKGLVSTCAIRRSSGNRLLDRTTCRLVRTRYRFDPARDAEGRPVRTLAVLPVEWMIP
jgi:protein TonB